MKKYLNLSFFKRPGFYVAIVSVILMYIGNIAYLGFSGTLLEYKDPLATIPAFLGILVFFLLLMPKKTSKYAGLGLWVLHFVTLMLYINAVYMYFTGIFYNGVSAEAFALIDSDVLVSMICYLLGAVAANVAIFLPLNEKQKKEEK